jgi:hypothetical protein
MQPKMTEKMLEVWREKEEEQVQPPLLRFVFAMSCHQLPPA